MFFGATIFYTRFSADDFFFVSEVRIKSWTSIFNYLQNDWHTRFSSNFVLTFLLQWSEKKYFLPFYFLGVFSLLFASIFRFLKYATLLYVVKLSNLNIVLLSINTIGMFFFCTFSVNDVWFWFTSSTGYFVSSIAFILGGSSFFKPTFSFIDYFLIVLSAFFISGSNEPMILISILLLGYAFFKTQSSEKKKMMFLAIIILMAGFLVIYLSAGTAKRDGITPSLSIKNNLLFAGYGTAKTLLHGVYKHFLPTLILSTPYLILGKQYNSKNFKRIDLIKELPKIIAFIGILIFVNQLIVIIPLGDFPPDRALIVSSILILIVIIRYFYKFGVLLPNNTIYIKSVQVVSLVSLLIFTIITTKIHQNYASHYDKRMVFLNTISISTSNSAPIYLEKLPPSGYLPSAEITADTTNFLNKNLKGMVNLNNDLILEHNFVPLQK